MSPGSTSTTERFSSRWGLLLSVLGIAIGTGNIWRFPRIAANNGGDEGAGAFLVAWLVFLFAWSIPLIIAEYAIGRVGRMGDVGSFIRVAGPRFAWMGGFVAFVATAIMFYYSVVAGWCFYYVGSTLLGDLPLTTDAARATWDGFQASGFPLALHAVAMSGGALAISRGVASIERVNRVLVPTLVAIVLIALARAVTLDGAGAGIAYLFTPQWEQLASPQLWLDALTQNAWDTGAGWGLILTYAAYMRKRDGVVKNAFITGVGNNVVSLIAAVTVFGTVFAVLGADMSRAEVLNIMRDSGPASTGLTFIWMPQLFARMPFGSTLAVLFFLGLSFAAISSLISMIELATRVLVDLGLPRPRAVVAVAGAGFLLGIPSALWVGFLGNQDFVWGVALMISGAFVAFAVTRAGLPGFRVSAMDGIVGDWSAGRAWDFAISRLVPAQAVVLLVWWLYLSASEYAPDSWYDPFDPYSVATCLVQWGAVAGLLIALNRWLVARTGLDRTAGDVPNRR